MSRLLLGRRAPKKHWTLFDIFVGVKVKGYGLLLLFQSFLSVAYESLDIPPGEWHAYRTNKRDNGIGFRQKWGRRVLGKCNPLSLSASPAFWSAMLTARISLAVRHPWTWFKKFIILWFDAAPFIIYFDDVCIFLFTCLHCFYLRVWKWIMRTNLDFNDKRWKILSRKMRILGW